VPNSYFCPKLLLLHKVDTKELDASTAAKTPRHPATIN